MFTYSVKCINGKYVIQRLFLGRYFPRFMGEDGVLWWERNSICFRSNCLHSEEFAKHLWAERIEDL